MYLSPEPQKTDPRHLLWAIPVAVVLGGCLWIFALLPWCGGGASVCSGTPEDVTESFFRSLGFLVYPAAAVAITIGLAPWTSRTWIRATVALVSGVLTILVGVAYMVQSIG